MDLSKVVANGGITPFLTWQGPWESHVRFRAHKGRNPPFFLAPQAPFRKFQGFLALVIVYVYVRTCMLGIVLESGASVLLVAPNPVASSCSLDSPRDIGDVPVQAPGPGRFKHRALAGAQGALRLAPVQCRDGTCTHEINT